MQEANENDGDAFNKGSTEQYVNSWQAGCSLCHAPLRMKTCLKYTLMLCIRIVLYNTFHK